MANTLASIRKKAKAGTSGGVPSEVSATKAVECFEVLQVLSPAFGRVFDDAESVKALASTLLTSRFGAEQEVVREGEAGTWLGILLSGELLVRRPGKDELEVLSPGALVGEQALWRPGAPRSETVHGKAPGGLMATILIDELPAFCAHHPSAAAKLLTLVGSVGAGRQLDAMREAARQPAPPSHGSSGPGAQTAPGSAPGPLGRLRSAEDSGAEAAALARLLSAAGLSGEEAQEVVSLCQFGPFSAGEALAAPSSPGAWPSTLAILLTGRVNLSPYGLAVSEGGLLGASEYFGVPMLSEAAEVVALTDGTLASLPYATLRRLAAAADGGSRAALAHRLLGAMGRYAALTCEEAHATLASAQLGGTTDGSALRDLPAASFSLPLVGGGSLRDGVVETYYAAKREAGLGSAEDAADAAAEADAAEEEGADEGGGGGGSDRGAAARRYQLLHAAVASKLERASGELRAARLEGQATAVSMRRAQRLSAGLHDALDLCTRHLAALIAASKASQGGELERLSQEGERLTQAAAAFEEAVSRRRAAAAARKQQGGGGGDDDDDGGEANDDDDDDEAEAEAEAAMAGEGLGEAMAKVRAWRPGLAMGGGWAARGGGGGRRHKGGGGGGSETQREANVADGSNSWGKDVRHSFQASLGGGGAAADASGDAVPLSVALQPPPPPLQPAAVPAAPAPPADLSMGELQRKARENERILQKATQQRDAAAKLLEAAAKERALILEEAKKIEEANAILEAHNAELLAAQVRTRVPPTFLLACVPPAPAPRLRPPNASLLTTYSPPLAYSPPLTPPLLPSLRRRPSSVGSSCPPTSSTPTRRRPTRR